MYTGIPAQRDSPTVSAITTRLRFRDQGDKGSWTLGPGGHFSDEEFNNALNWNSLT